MARFAPANCLLYVEVNRPLAVLDSIQQTETWKIIQQHEGSPVLPTSDGALQQFIKLTGIGPIDSVILSRAQAALVITDLGATEEGETLKVKPEGALILETHTAQRRIRGPVQRIVGDLATKAYGAQSPRRSTIEGVEFVEWTNSNKSRQIVVAFYDSAVIIGNSQRSVLTCLTVARQRTPSLKEDLEFGQKRAEANANASLIFGFVPASESARLLTFGLPIVLGRSPADPGLKEVIQASATRLFGNITWSSRPFKSGIEDRYQVSLQPSLIAQMKPNLTRLNSITEPLRSQTFYSMTHYRFDDPLRVWQGLKTAVSAHVDTMSAVFLNSILRSSLVSYGIAEPEPVLGAIKDVTTVRLDPDGDRQLLIAGVSDASALLRLFESKLGFKKHKSVSADVTVLETLDGDTAVALSASIFVIGNPSDVQHYFQTLKAGNEEINNRLNHFGSGERSSHITTYTNDEERIRGFVTEVLVLSDVSAADVIKVEQGIRALPFAITETTLNDQGVERVTRSPLGQFSTLIPLFIAEASPANQSADNRPTR